MKQRRMDMIHETVMSIYSDKLAHIQVVINSRYFIAQMCTCEDTLAHNLGAPYIDDIMSYNSLTTLISLSLLCNQHTEIIKILDKSSYGTVNCVWSPKGQSHDLAILKPDTGPVFKWLLEIWFINAQININQIIGYLNDPTI